MSTLKGNQSAPLCLTLQRITQHPLNLMGVESKTITKGEGVRHIWVLSKVPTIYSFGTFKPESSSMANAQEVGDIRTGEPNNRQFFCCFQVTLPSGHLTQKPPSINNRHRVMLLAGSGNNTSHVLEAVTDAQCEPTSRLEQFILLTLKPRLFVKKGNKPRRKNCSDGTHSLNPSGCITAAPGEPGKDEANCDDYRREENCLTNIGKSEVECEFLVEHLGLLLAFMRISLPGALALVHGHAA